MVQSSKGSGINIRIILMILVGVLTLALVVPSIIGTVGGAENQSKGTYDNTAPKVGESACAADCRQDHPGGGAEYEGCKAGC
ncbi:hypothetical protein GLU64_00665 [Nanohaloarchaea archaeon]|nr:hypothetical protein [Candidatus Nanohaloarchaea archaeon]